MPILEPRLVSRELPEDETLNFRASYLNLSRSAGRKSTPVYRDTRVLRKLFVTTDH